MLSYFNENSENIKKIPKISNNEKTSLLTFIFVLHKIGIYFNRVALYCHVVSWQTFHDDFNKTL
ncbi:MAG: hypothetical protein LBL62_04380 [Planctomycetaceae bacterium]|nr:hypothetical protein [Planctomycetaceae bacterium]